VRAGLVFGRMSYGLRIGLLEESKDAGGCFIAGLVEEGHDVLCAMLPEKRQYFNCPSGRIPTLRTSPKIRLNMVARFNMCLAKLVK
jgi:hypothetical protein